ncbi:MAG: VWA domain-containing protein, partial [Casimicrobiaceae bacterium]
MKFAWPVMLWFLLLGPLLAGAYVLLLRRRQRVAVRYPDIGLIRRAMSQRHRWRRHIPPFLFLCSMIAVIIGLGRPAANIPLPSLRQTIILAVDVSLSMDANDVDPNRLTAAQAAAKAFIEGCPAEVRIGLIAFGGSAAEVQAPTDNRAELLAAIDGFRLQRGTATGSALYAALASLLPEAGPDLRTLDFDGRSSRNQRAASLDQPRKPRKQAAATVLPGSFTSGAIILMSDGKSTMGPNPLDAAEVAAEHGVRVFTIGFGTKQGAIVRVQGMSIFVQLDEETLQA